MRRLALFASLLAAVAVTGTASGSIDRTPRDVIEQALLKVRSAPDVSDIAKNRGNRVRVIVTLDDPPLAAATFARRLPGFGNRREAQLLVVVFALVPEQARGGAGERDCQRPRADPRGNRVAALPGARERVRRERPIRAVAGPPRGRGREPRLSELLVHALPEPRAVGARDDRLLGADRRARRRRQGGRRRRRRRSRARVPQSRRLLVSRGLSEGNVRLDHPEGDRGPRLRGARSEQHAARSRQLLPRHACRGRDRGSQDRRRSGADGHLHRVGGRLPPGRGRPRRRRPPRVHRQLPGLQCPCSGAARRLLLGEQPRDRRRLRGSRAGRDGHHQLLGWWAAGGSPD